MATVTRLNLKAETGHRGLREAAEDEAVAATRDSKTKRVAEESGNEAAEDEAVEATSDSKTKRVAVELGNEAAEDEAVAATRDSKRVVVELGNGSQVIYVPRFLAYDRSWDYLGYLNKNIPWNRPTLRVFGRSCVQPRDSCYVASEGLPQLVYSGYQPHAYSWDEFPPLKDILDAVQKALPGSRFNSLLLNRYKRGDDYVGWHADDEKLYGPTPEIASLSFGCEREFLLKKRSRGTGEPPKKQLKKADQHSFVLKHGSLLVMRGYTQRDWLHSVPKRVKADSLRINLTFRLVV